MRWKTCRIKLHSYNHLTPTKVGQEYVINLYLYLGNIVQNSDGKTRISTSRVAGTNHKS